VSFIMPDVRNMTEADARDAVLAASGNTAQPLYLYPSVNVGFGYDDHDTLGAASDNISGLTAATVGADGTISAQFPAPGESVLDDSSMSFDVWGVGAGDLGEFDQISTTLGAWAQTPETTAYGSTGEPLTTGPWTTADFDAGSSFRVELWTLHKPSGTGTLIGEVTQFSDISVKESLCDQTELRFTMSMEDPLLEDWTVDAYTQAAKVYYRNQIKPVYYGPVTYSEDYSTGEGKLTITGVNAIRMKYQFIRRGDDALNGPDDEGSISMDGSGYNKLLDAAENTLEQDARDVPTLGIHLDNQGTTDADLLVGVERGDNVWDTAQGISSNVLGRDFELDPQADVDGLYMLFRVWNKRGSDRTATVRYFFGVDDPTANPGIVDNVSRLTATPLQRITHCHVLDSERRYRVTAASADASAAAGVFVAWVQSDLKVVKRPSTKQPDLRPLQAIARATVDAYSSAPRSVDMELRPDAGQTSFYREHFWPGDTVWIHARRGFREFSGNYRIRDVEITEQGSRGMTVTKLSVVPDIAADELDEDS
jgi:hypothetical protein